MAPKSAQHTRNGIDQLLQEHGQGIDKATNSFTGPTREGLGVTKLRFDPMRLAFPDRKADGRLLPADANLDAAYEKFKAAERLADATGFPGVDAPTGRTFVRLGEVSRAKA
jgi:hypothetical protein